MIEMYDDYYDKLTDISNQAVSGIDREALVMALCVMVAEMCVESTEFDKPLERSLELIQQTYNNGPVSGFIH